MKYIKKYMPIVLVSCCFLRAAERNVQDKPERTSTPAAIKNTPESVQTLSDKKETLPTAKQQRTLNEIRAVVYGSGPMTEPGQTVRPVETLLVLTYDITRPWLDGKPRTLRDLVLEQLMIFDAKRLNQSISDEETDKMVNQLQKNNNLTHDQLESQIALIGYTFDDFREQLKRKQLVDRIVEYRVYSDKRLAVSQADIESYWEKHGPTQEATYGLADSKIKTAENREDFEQKLQAGAFEKIFKWDEPMIVKQSELPKDKLFVTEKNVGDIVSIDPVDGGYELTKLVSKTDPGKVPLKTGNAGEDPARIAEITRALKQQHFIEIMEDYQADLLAHAKIDFKYARDREEVLGKKV